jgi:hypothetical protein
LTYWLSLICLPKNLQEFSPFPITHFSPVIEPPSPDAFLSKKPDTVYSRNEVARKPWIFGITAQEGYLGLLRETDF